MSNIANYTFLPWLRQGLANEISGRSGLRATIAVDLTLSGATLDGGTDTRPPIHKDIEIYGPGDIVGIEQSAIIKTEPRNWITNFEPNYLPYIEFYDEDFPWRYSPQTPDGHRLHPWITLVVLKDDEFTDGKNIKDRPLPYITFGGAGPLPPSGQLWAWSHIHVNKNIIGADFETNNAADVQSSLGALLRADPDMAYSRILCPRKLEGNSAYHAFLVPVFETGRLAGLGQDPAGAGSHDELAWANATPSELPYFHRWYFRTGIVGDFEYLVRLLKPQPVDSRVGLRDMDVQKPGANIEGIVDDPAALEDQKLGGILKLGGALRVPDIFYDAEEFAVVKRYRNWPTLNNQDYPHPFQQDVASFINLTDSYEEKNAEQANSDAGISEVQEATDPDTEFDISNNPDPLITAPLYGRWHALTQRLLKTREDTDIEQNENWVHDLNLDPRWRVAAGFGTKIVQENQENYMQAAWEQVGDILKSNNLVRLAQVGKETSWVWYQSHIRPIKEKNSAKWMTLAAPVHLRVLNDGVTVSHQVSQSKIPRVMFSPPIRKLMQPRGRLVKRLPFDSDASPDNLISRINDGAVSPAPPRVTPDANTVKDVADVLKPDNIPGFLVDWLERYPWIKWIPLVLAVLLVLSLMLLTPSAAIMAVGLAIATTLVLLYRRLSKADHQIDIANSVLEENQTPEAVDKLPHSPDFRISTPEENFTPTLGGNVDSIESTRFKQALKDVNLMLQESFLQGFTPPKPALNLAAVSDTVFVKLDPTITIPDWVWGGVFVPPRIKDQQDEDFVEAMAYPEIDQPMYKPLAEYSSEKFLPNINFVAENSISLLETNQKFVESYMVGLNHEFARELLWREYPTDQRGSYFRQFWEAQGYHSEEDLSAEDLKEKLRDIPPIHRWLKRSDLGDHDHRELPGENEEEVVLVIRGELLKRYPNAVIYAHRAVWRDDTEDGNPILDIAGGQTIDLTKERDLRPMTDSEAMNPSRNILKSPLYEAKVEPDIYFFGFDLTVCAAKGGTGKEDQAVDARCAAEGVEWHDPGWFFVIKERPGEIAMGLDVPQDDDNLDNVKNWNDLSWNHVKPPVSGGGFLQINDDTEDILLRPLDLPQEQEKEEQKLEDERIHWNKNMSSADLAYILYQVPVLVAVHASEMLPKND